MNETAVRSRLSPWKRVSLGGLVALIGGGGGLHFVVADSYALTIPSWLGNPYPWVYASGLVEMACGLGLLIPRTRRIAAWVTVIVLIGIFPANIKMALDGGIPGARPPLDSALASWIRLPFQFLFVYWAWTFTRDPERTSEAGTGLRREPERIPREGGAASPTRPS